MAIVDRRRVVINGPRRHKRRNRKLTAKQIKFFGTPAQKAALKRKNRRHASAGTQSRRNSPARKTVSRARHYHRRKAKRSSNPGDILSLVLNPGKGKSMAAPKRRRRHHRVHHRRRHLMNSPRHHRRRRLNAAAPRRRHYHRRRNYRRNAPRGSRGVQGVTQTMFILVGGGVGFFGSKAATQMVMGANNTGMGGYFGNAIATAALTVAAAVLPPTRKFAPAVAAGGILQIIMRILTDYTPFGQVTQSLGVGDYQMQNFVTPQRLVDPLNSAQIEIPSGWGAPPPVVVATAAPPGGVHGTMLPAAGMHGYGSMYTGGGGMY